MARYLVQGSYTSEAVSDLLKNPQDRGTMLRELIQRLGGKVHSFDFCFGDYHFVSIGEFPDNETMEALNLAIYGSGAFKDIKVTVLIPMEEAVGSMIRAAASEYRPPGG